MAAALGAATFIHDRYEADDLIATLCRQLTAAGHAVVVVTSDKDLAQLVTDRVTLFDFGKGLRFGPAEVEAAFGVRPDQIVDLLALAGDPVDNIPAYGSLDGLYASLEELRTSRRRAAKSLYSKLRDARDVAFLSRRLATLAAERADLARLAYRGPDAEAAAALFARLGFKHLGERLPAKDRRGAGPPAVQRAATLPSGAAPESGRAREAARSQEAPRLTHTCVKRCISALSGVVMRSAPVTTATRP